MTDMTQSERKKRFEVEFDELKKAMAQLPEISVGEEARRHELRRVIERWVGMARQGPIVSVASSDTAPTSVSLPLLSHCANQTMTTKVHLQCRR
jgi:hypothetical protein